MDMRGSGRKLALTDFGKGKIEKFTISELGKNWDKLEALAAYRLNDFLSSIPYKWTITSAFRTPEQNTAAGGVQNSPHLEGRAFDVWIYDPDFFRRDRLEYYVKLAGRVGFNGVGIYQAKQFLHMDVRPKAGSWGAIQKVVNGKKTQTFIGMATALEQFSKAAAASWAAALVVLALVFLFSRSHS